MPFFPNIMTLSLQTLISSIDQFTDKIKRNSELVNGGNFKIKKDTNFINNLLILLQWQQRSIEDNPVKYLGYFFI